MKRLEELTPLPEEEKRILTRCRQVFKKIDPDVQVILYGRGHEEIMNLIQTMIS